MGVKFDGADDVYPLKDFGVLGKCSIFAVVKFADSGSLRGICGSDGTGSAWHLHKGSDDKMMWYCYGIGDSVVGTTVLSVNTFYLVSCVYDGVNLAMRLNGVEEATTAATADIASGAVNIGRAYNSSRTLNGDIAELLIYPNIAANGTDLTDFESYLMTKYALT